MTRATATRSARRLVLAGLACAAGLGLAACESSSDAVTYNAITGDLTPELRGTTDRPIDVDWHNAVSMNKNLRSISDDWQRIWMLNGPSRLSPYPLYNASGSTF